MVASGTLHTVKLSDILFLIVQRFYGYGNLWHLIYEANREMIGNDPNLLKLGTVLVIPPKNQPAVNKGSFRELLEALAAFQTELPSKDPNQYKVENELGLIGKYQFAELLLIDLGYYKANVYYGHGADKNYWQGTWTGKRGIDSKSKLQNSPNVQEVIILEAFELNCQRINDMLTKKEKTINHYFGHKKTFNDRGVSKTITITLAGILAGAHLRGPYGVAEILLKNQVYYDEFGISILRYMGEYSGYEVTVEDFLPANS